MMLRKMLSRLLIAALLMATFVLPAEAVVSGFTDVDSDHFYYDAISYLEANGVVVGYSDRSFGADLDINRAEFLKIVMEVSDYEAAGTNCYPDVKDEWFAPYVCKATELGFVQGYDDGLFRPAQKINFAEASKIIVNVLNVEMENNSSDIWYKNFVYALEDHFAIPATISSFDENVNRGEMAEMIYRLDALVTSKLSSTFADIEEGKTAGEVGEDLKSFRSCAALGNYLGTEPDYGDYYPVEEALPLSAVDSTSSIKSADAPSVAPTPGGGGEGDFSTTNVQVEGVDEADIVKTDGKFIYSVSSSEVRVVTAYPPGTMAVLDSVNFNDDQFYPSELYVDGGKLVVIGTSYQDFNEMTLYSMPVRDPGYYGSLTKVFIFDIGTAGDLTLSRELSFEGDYTTSRKVDDTLYLVANKYQYYYPMPVEPMAEDVLPLYADSSTQKIAPIAGCADIDYMPGTESKNFLIIAGIPVNDPNAAISEQTVLGSSGNVFASRDNLYVAEQNYNWFYWGDGASEEETIIHKFALDKTNITYEGNGKVLGTILNQFSMDESSGYFRIATTLGNVWDEVNPAKNNVYVLNSNMETVGSLEGLAPGESIYSVRFMGDRGYIVTFKKIDPLFVIDLSVPTAPKVLGKLKIPGYSDYLHPYDENHIIGFGKEAVDAGEGQNFAWYQGMKIAMFDVSDVENPVELHKVVIGDRGTDSELLWNHKALLFDKARGFMAFPVTVAEIPQTVKDDPAAVDSAYGDYVFQGAYVYDVSVENGFDLRGTITQYDANEVADLSGSYWYGSKDVARVLRIGNYLYTVSDGMVKASNLDDLADVNSVELPVSNSYYYPDVVF